MRAYFGSIRTGGAFKPVLSRVCASHSCLAPLCARIFVRLRQSRPPGCVHDPMPPVGCSADEEGLSEGEVQPITRSGSINTYLMWLLDDIPGYPPMLTNKGVLVFGRKGIGQARLAEEVSERASPDYDRPEHCL